MVEAKTSTELEIFLQTDQSFSENESDRISMFHNIFRLGIVGVKR